MMIPNAFLLSPQIIITQIFAILLVIMILGLKELLI